VLEAQEARPNDPRLRALDDAIFRAELRRGALAPAP